MIGYSRNELEGKSARMMYPSDAEFERVGRVKHPKVLAYGTGSIETQFKHKNGRIIDVLLSSSSILPDDLSGGMIFTVMDITERKRTETALLKSEEKYRELVENINDVIYVTDAEGKLVYISPVIESVTGYTHSEILGQNFSLFIYHEDMPLLIERFQELPSGVIRPTEYRIVTKSGQIKWVRTSSKPVYNESIFTGIRGILTDITESKKIEEDKKKLHGQLQQAQKMEAIGTLAGGIAHDFNNILSAVIGYAELGLNDAEKESSVYRNLHEVLRAAGRAKNLVTQILAFSRQAEQERKPVQVEPIVKEVLKFLRASLPTTIEIRQNIQSDSLIMADPTQIHQILMNLCTNAGHAMRKKGGLLEVKLADIEVEADFAVDYLDLKPGAYLALEVSDNGHGIPGNVMDRIFDPFFTTKEKGEGTGMGLSVVHGIVGSFGGKISVSSEPGQGATFRIYLPVVSKRQETSVETEEILPTGSERILFVDDEPALVNIGKQSLESLGYRVTVRTSSREALELFKAEPHRFDLVITDMTMPNMTGDDLARELIRINPQIPVILCTGYSAQIDQELAMGIGIRAFVSKPMLRREIGETIRKVLDE